MTILHKSIFISKFNIKIPIIPMKISALRTIENAFLIT